MQYNIDKYVSRPIRCFTCWRLRHSSTSCHSKPASSICTSPDHRADSCSSLVPRCINCRGMHASTSLDCPLYQKELSICTLQADLGISFLEARSRIEASSLLPRDPQRQTSPPSSSSDRPSTTQQVLPSCSLLSSAASQSLPLTSAQPPASSLQPLQSLPYSSNFSLSSQLATQRPSTSGPSQLSLPPLSPPTLSHLPDTPCLSPLSAVSDTSSATLFLLPSTFRRTPPFNHFTMEHARFSPSASLCTTCYIMLHPSILCLQETHLRPLSRCSLASYQDPVRFDRSVQRGGGVALFVGSSIPCSPLTLVTPLEAVAAQIYLPQCHLTVCSLYLPPQLPNDSLSEHLTSLTRSLPSPYLLAMDANAHHPHWGSSAVDARAAILFDFLDSANLVCLNSGEPTFCSSSSHIDLTFCSPTLAPLFSWHPHFDSFNSDHFPILLDSSFSSPCTSSIPKWNLSAADWDRFRSDLHLPTQFESPDQSCQSTSDALLSAATHSDPLSTPRPRRRVAFCWTRACTEARRKKNVALTRYRHHRGDVSAWINFKKAQASFRLTVRQAKQSSWSQFVSGLSSSCTSSQVWKRVRLLRASVKRRLLVLWRMVRICLLRLKLLSYWQIPLPLRVMVLLVTNSSWHTRFNLRQFLLSFPLITALLIIAPFPSLSCRSHSLLLPLELLVSIAFLTLFFTNCHTLNV